MKRFRNLSILLSAALLAVIITFASCKKDKDNNVDVGTKAANELCGCFTEMMNDEEDDMAGVDCMINFYGNYSKYITYDSKSELGFKFTDADFEKGFMAGIEKCQALDE